MIYDKLSNLKKYSFANEDLAEAVDFISGLDLETIETGYSKDFGNFKVSVSEYMSKHLNQSKYEMHRKAIDIHIVIKGVEYMECVECNEVNIDEPYDEVRECALGTAENNCSIRLKPKAFVIFFPWDAHLVGAHEHTSQQIRKLVAKVYTL